MPATTAHFLRDLAIVLSVAALATVVFQRLKLPIVAGYLVAGILVGPEIASRLITDPGTIRTMADLGVVLLMVSVGLEFRIRRLVRLGSRVGMTALVEIGLMLALGFGLGKALGWSQLESLLAAGIVAISSTTVIAKVFDERPVDWRVRNLVFGVLVVEDLVAIVLVAVCTTAAFGADLTVASIGRLVGRLFLLLITIFVVGMIAIPPLIRTVVRLQRQETTLVTAVGLTFLAAMITESAGYSVALGAFTAGVLMSESGVGHQVGEVLRPVRDLFGAVFFIAVGMLLDLDAALAAWPLIIGFVAIVVIGKFIGVTVGSFLTGFGTVAAVSAGMSMTQIGEFSFIIAGLGATSGSAHAPLYAVAVSTAIVTAFLTPALVSRAGRVASWVDRRLPAPLQTFATLHAAWMQDIATSETQKAESQRTRKLLRFVAVDGLIVAAALIATSIGYRSDWLARFGLPGPAQRLAILALGAVVAVPFGLGLVRSVRRLARHWSEEAVPPVEPGKVDQGRAPRRLLLLAIEILMAIGLGVPLVAITLPFLPPYGAPGVIVAVLALLGFAFWRTARDLESHARAGAELVVHVLARQGARADAASFEIVRGMLPGLGELVPVRVEAGSEAVGRTLGELNFRGRTGATVVALVHGGERHVFPKASERLQAGDLIALTGSHDAITRAEALARARGTSSRSSGTAATDSRAEPTSSGSEDLAPASQSPDRIPSGPPDR